MLRVVAVLVAVGVATSVMAQRGRSGLRPHRKQIVQTVIEKFRSESRFPGAVAGAWFSDIEDIPAPLSKLAANGYAGIQTFPSEYSF